MPLKNYTSQVSAERSIARIEQQLSRYGASQILKMYDANRRLEAIAFILPVEDVNMSFKLDAKVARVEVVLKKRIHRPRPGTLKRLAEQAERTAWKIESDWLDAQMAKIELSQTEFMEVFMPYLYNHADKRTYFEIVKEKGFQKLLPMAVAP